MYVSDCGIYRIEEIDEDYPCNDRYYALTYNSTVWNGDTLAAAKGKATAHRKDFQRWHCNKEQILELAMKEQWQTSIVWHKE